MNELTIADKTRLATQSQRLFTKMSKAPHYWTLRTLSHDLNISEAGVSARLRDFRKPEWGGHTVLKKRTAYGNRYCYKLVPNGPLLDGKRNTPTLKTEARERVTAFLAYRDKWQTNGHNQITTYGPPLLASDLRELLK